MLNLIATVLLLGAALVLVKWLTGRYDALGRPKPLPWISTVLLVGLAAAALAPGILRARLEDRLGDAASHLVGSPVGVSCQGFGEAFVDAHTELGYVAFDADGRPQPATLIKRKPCRDLSAYLRSDKSMPSEDQIVAVHVLTHEAMHMKGSIDEAETECLAAQHNAEMAMLLGAPAEAAKRLSVRYWEAVYPRMPPAYRTDQCGPGRALDIGSPAAPWTDS